MPAAYTPGVCYRRLRRSSEPEPASRADVNARFRRPRSAGFRSFSRKDASPAKEGGGESGQEKGDHRDVRQPCDIRPQRVAASLTTPSAEWGVKTEGGSRMVGLGCGTASPIAPRFSKQRGGFRLGLPFERTDLRQVCQDRAGRSNSRLFPMEVVDGAQHVGRTVSREDRFPTICCSGWFEERAGSNLGG